MKQEAKISLVSFLSFSPITIFLIFPYLGLDAIYKEIGSIIWWIFLSYIVFVNVLIQFVFTGYLYEIAVRGAFLGTVFAGGILVSIILPEPWSVFGWYMCVMAFFHYSEFLTIAVTNPKTLSVDSYILNHSNEYKIAAVASWLEFFLEAYFYPDLKPLPLVSYVGLSLCIGGECLRKLAMLTAHSNFNHVVQNVKHSDHQLITHGVYSRFRHPSYVGWFYWSMGTQMILVNPICFVAYILASWKFFNDRITVEEITLLNFFEEKYMDYQAKVPTGLPFIKGFVLEE